MTQIKIEVPANDHIALSAMADALQRIAAERAPQELTPSEIGHSSLKAKEGTILRALQDSQHVPEDSATARLDELHATLVKRCEEFKTPKGDDFVEQVDVHFGGNDVSPDKTTADDTLDADGLPWDKRIHSRGKTRLSDDTWRLARKPNDKTDEEWSAYVESVKSELKAVQDIPTLDEQCGDVGIVRQEADTPTLDEQAVADLTPPVVDEPAVQMEGVTPNGDVAIEPPVTTVGAPVAPVTPPTSLTPPTVEPSVEAPSDQPSVTTFQELMLYITGNAKKRGADNDMIKATLAEVDPALTVIPLIATRADLIPKFVTALEAKLS